ncbi:MAG TPA: MATE family efflux transporter [Candidatus Blautia excrementipullorum]|nr:MATE family efflux transporter [Candidatus Blautia excrementipullorum]
MELEKKTDSRMALEPVGRLMISIGLPIVLSMMLQAAYNIVDSAYLSNMKEAGEEALTALGLAFPVQLLMIAIAVGTGVGTNALLSKSLGQGDREKAGRSAGNAVFMGILIYIVFLLFGFLGVPLYVNSQNAGGNISQIASGVLALIFHLRLDSEIGKGIKYLKPNIRILKEIYAIGLPAIISQALLTVMTYGLNIIFGQLPQVGESAVTVYGLYCKIQQLIIFAAVGVRDAITPIVSFNFGMRNKKRIKEGIRYGMLFTFILMVIGLLVIELFARPLTSFFSLSDTTYTMCVDCMKIVSLGFIFAGLCIAFQGVFQAIECGLQSLFISVGRQVLFILPVAWFIGRFVTGAENVSIIWWTFLIGEGITLICTFLMYIPAVKKKINVLEKSSESRYMTTNCLQR